MNFRELVLTQAKPISDEDALKEAQAWGFETVEDFNAALNEADEEFQREMEKFERESAWG